MIPPDQSFGADDTAGLEVDLRLMEQSEVARRDRRPQLAEQLQTSDVRLVVVGRCEHVGSAGLLRLVHRRIGSSHQRRRRFAVARIERDPGRRAGLDRHVVDGDRWLEAAGNRLGDRGSCPCRSRRQDHRELIAAQSSDGRTLRHVRRKPAGNGLEQLIADGVTKRVVDFLEPVEIQDQDGELVAGPPRVFQTTTQLFVEQAPVRQSGQ